VKEAHDRSGDVIVRLYESLGERATTAVTLGFVRAAVVETDLLERPTGEPVPADEPVRLEFRPFEIKTLRISRPRD
jgi:alpha-mannosidase